MERYSNANHLLNISAFGGPILPFMLLGYFYPRSAPLVNSPSFLLLWVVGLVVGYLMIAVHELGHAFAGRLMGIEIKAITIGHWRKLFTFRLRSTQVTVRAAPSSGYVSAKPTLKLYSGPRATVFLLAGVAAELGLVALVAWIPPVGWIESLWDVVLAVVRLNIFCLGGFHMVMNLWPHDGLAGGARYPSDGKQLLNLWKNHRRLPAERAQFQRFAEVDRLRAEKRFPEARDLLVTLAAEQPANLALQQTVGLLHCECGDIPRALTLWREILAKPGHSPQQLAELLDALSCLPIYYGRRDLLNEAEAWTREALRYVPGAITLKGTLSGILIELGRADEGVPLAREVIRRSDDAVDQAISHAYLAKASLARGDTAEAHRLLARAREIEPEHVVVKRIGDEFAAGSPAP